MRLLYTRIISIFFTKYFSPEGGLAGNCRDGCDKNGNRFVGWWWWIQEYRVMASIGSDPCWGTTRI